MRTPPSRPLWWRALYALLAVYGSLLLYVAILMLFMSGNALSTGIRELATNILLLLFLPCLLLGLWVPRLGRSLMLAIAGAHVLLGIIELWIPNPLGDAFAEVPNHPLFLERFVFLILPAVIAFFLLLPRASGRSTVIPQAP
ncbi:MAG TPA: hypothetical protein VGN16_06305 [Acidobacteriaceae bacterium]|jgi:hypothetical protein